MKIRVGYGLGTQTMGGGPAQFAQLVDELERLRFDSLWLSERVTGAAPDPLVALAFAAARTARLKLGTSVLVLPGRNPALLAKELASLDVLSNGRLLPAFGLGVADPNEQQAFGVAREERAKVFDEALALIRAFWTGDPVDHDGPHFYYHGLQVRPAPKQSPPDVWLGGRAPSELRRIGRVADGWLPSFTTPSEAEQGRRTIEKVAAEHGRHIDDEHFGALVPYVRNGVPERTLHAIAARRPEVDPRELIPGNLDEVGVTLRKFIDVGFSKFVLVPVAEPADWSTELEQVAAVARPIEN